MVHTGIDPGLCGRCRYGQRVVTGKGAVFLRCRRSATDSRFPKYPRLPVVQCPGFQPAAAHEDPGTPDDRAGTRFRDP